MSKTPWTLEEDIKHVLNTGEGWTDEISQWVGSDIAKSLSNQLGGIRGEGRNLRVSSLGTKCERKLWYSVNRTDEPSPLPPFTRSKFIFGDLTESYVLGLCMAAGYNVGGLQTTLDVCGIRGHRDCVINGMLFDVKSTATRSFQNFTRGGVRNNDAYGYVSQLSSYLYASRDDPLVTYKDMAGFIFVDKQFGNIAVEMIDLTEEVANKEEEVARKKAIVKQKKPPVRKYQADFGKKGSSLNPAIPMNPCGYCQFKHECWGQLYEYRHVDNEDNRIWFTEVNKELGEKWVRNTPLT